MPSWSAQQNGGHSWTAAVPAPFRTRWPPAEVCSSPRLGPSVGPWASSEWGGRKASCSAGNAHQREKASSSGSSPGQPQSPLTLSLPWLEAADNGLCPILESRGGSGRQGGQSPPSTTCTGPAPGLPPPGVHPGGTFPTGDFCLLWGFPEEGVVVTGQRATPHCSEGEGSLSLGLSCPSRPFWNEQGHQQDGRGPEAPSRQCWHPCSLSGHCGRGFRVTVPPNSLLL